MLRTYRYVRSVYEALDAGERLGLVITEGPHQDTQELRVPVFKWFDRHLLKTNRVIDPALRLFDKGTSRF